MIKSCFCCSGVCGIFERLHVLFKKFCSTFVQSFCIAFLTTAPLPQGSFQQPMTPMTSKMIANSATHPKEYGAFRRFCERNHETCREVTKSWGIGSQFVANLFPQETAHLFDSPSCEKHVNYDTLFSHQGEVQTNGFRCSKNGFWQMVLVLVKNTVSSSLIIVVYSWTVCTSDFFHVRNDLLNYVALVFGEQTGC